MANCPRRLCFGSEDIDSSGGVIQITIVWFLKRELSYAQKHGFYFLKIFLCSTEERKSYTS